MDGIGRDGIGGLFKMVAVVYYCPLCGELVDSRIMGDEERRVKEE